MSTLVLTQDQVEVLNKGLSFCQTPGDVDMSSIVGDLDKMVRTMRYKAFFHKGDLGDQLLHKKVTPPNLIHYICLDIK